MEELFDICDEYGQPTGKTVARSIAHRDGIMHRTAHIWIVREYEGRKQILLQKRSMNTLTSLFRMLLRLSDL